MSRLERLAVEMIFHRFGYILLLLTLFFSSFFCSAKILRVFFVFLRYPYFLLAAYGAAKSVSPYNVLAISRYSNATRS